MKMFEDGQDPWSKIQELEALVMHHHKQLRLLENNQNELIRAYTAQAKLVEQITLQNTELLEQMAILKGFGTA
jgi:dephospho-CoA kinase